MITSKDVLDAIMLSKKCTKYRAGQLLEVSTSAPTNWQKGKTGMSDQTVEKALEILGWNEKPVWAGIIAERNKGTPVYIELANMADDLQREYLPQLSSEYQQSLPLAG